MAESIEQRLFRYAKPYQTSRLGPSIDDIARIEVTDRLLDDLSVALETGDFDATKCALFFCQGLLKGEARSRIVRLLNSEVSHLVKSRDPDIRSYVVPVLVAMRSQLPDFRQTMLTFLHDPSVTVRTAALLASETFLRKDEIEPLVQFQSDDRISETGGMGGPWRYIYRDEALLRIEKLADRSFRKHELSDVKNNQVIFWWDWAPF